MIDQLLCYSFVENFEDSPDRFVSTTYGVDDLMKVHKILFVEDWVENNFEPLLAGEMTF